MLAISLIATLLSNCNLAAEQLLKPWETNPWYWSFGGEPVLLLGASDDDNLFQWPEKELIKHLDLLQKSGGNVIRNTMSDRDDKGFEIYAFKQSEGSKYDLEKWNEAYWKRFERLLRETAKRGIYVQIEVWDRFDFTDKNESNHWKFHPFNPANNINYTYQDSHFGEHYPEHPAKNLQPFFFTTPKQQDNQTVLRYQQRFVDKLLDHSLKYDHVLYCIDNETTGEEEWARYWAQFIKDRAFKDNKKVCVTEMWDDWDLSAERHKRTFDHPELYEFVDVSQNNHNRGQQHWDGFLQVKDYLSSKPRPMNTTKTYGANGNKFGHTDQDGVERFWRHLLAGAASIRFHRPDAGLGLSEKSIHSIQAARKLESLIPLWSVEPANELLTGREENESYAAALKGKAYVVYFPAGGEVKLDLSDAEGSLRAQWINIDTGEMGPTSEIASNVDSEIVTPSTANWVIAIVDSVDEVKNRLPIPASGSF